MTIASDHGAAQSRHDSISEPKHPRNYVDLVGGRGREVNFRPLRRSASELGLVSTLVTIGLDGAPHACPLVDVSQNGVAVVWSGPRPPELGETVDRVSIAFDRLVSYRGRAKVASIRDVNGATVAGMALLDGLLDLDEVVELGRVNAACARELSPLRERPWRFSGDSFKSLLAELRLLGIDARERLSALEASLSPEVIHGGRDTAANAALTDRIRMEVVSELAAVCVALGALPFDHEPAEQQAVEEYTRRQVGEFFLASPWMRRAKAKPLGYPGDFELMKGIYGIGAYSGFSGSDLLAKAFNLLCVELPSATAVVNRKDLVKAALSAMLSRTPPSGRPFRIMSIAAGPAQEVFELLQSREEIAHPVEIFLFDQDGRALDFAYRRLKRLVDEKWSGRVRVVYVNDTIKHLLKDAAIFRPYGEFDVVFSCGLYDYLPRPVAISLTANLFACLGEGGELYIGNQTPRTPSRWLIESIADWRLIYRNHDEIFDFASSAVPNAELALIEEPTFVNPLVRLAHR